MNNHTRIVAVSTALLGGSVLAFAPLGAGAGALAPNGLATGASRAATGDASAPTTAGVPPPTPPTNPLLAARIPAIDGYSSTALPADDPFWPLFDASIPAHLARHHVLVTAADGAPVARMAVASGIGERPIDTFVEQVFADEVQLPADAAVVDEGTFVVANSAAPIWIEMEGSAVIVAHQAIDGNFQWAWAASDAVWIVRGGRDAEDFVRALLRAQAPSLDPYDQQGMTGDLFDYTPSVPGYMYFDSPRNNTLANLPGNWLGECAERFYLGWVRPDTAANSPHQPADLDLAISKAAGWCVGDGALLALAADLAARPGVVPQQIGGLTAYAGPQLAVALVGDVVVVLGSGDPQTFVDMAPFIEAYFTGLPR